MSDSKPRITTPGEGLFFGIELDDAVDKFAGLVVSDPPIDAVTLELVRLRCAQYHECRVCGSTRDTSALQAGLDEDLVTKVLKYETSDLPDRAKAILRFTDAMIMRPAEFTLEARADLLRYFTEAEIAGVALHIMKWSVQKVLVALNLDGAPWQGVTSMSWDPAYPGYYRFDEALEGATPITEMTVRADAAAWEG
jgi:hypothetical protein